MFQPQAASRFIESMAGLFQRMGRKHWLLDCTGRSAGIPARYGHFFSSEVITAQVWKALKRAAIGLFARHLKPPSQPYFHLYNQYVPRHLGPIPIAKPKSITRSNSFKKDSSIVGNLTATQLRRSAAWDSVLDKRRSDHHHRATSILMKLSFSHRG